MMPRIGVSWVRPDDEKSDRYVAAVRLAGGAVMPLPAGATSWDVQLATIEGLVLTGGGDVDPALYREQNVACRGIDRTRDELEINAYRHCLARNLPVLAICRGFQLVNVAMGGSLVQDIATNLVHRSQDDKSSFHQMEILEGTLLAEGVGQGGQITVNSRHHQGVTPERVAPDLRISAIATDNVVEGLELPGANFIVAVQCHPEYLDQVPELRWLFSSLLSAACRL